MFYAHDIESALDDKVEGGLSPAVLERELERARRSTSSARGGATARCRCSGCRRGATISRR